MTDPTDFYQDMKQKGYLTEVRRFVPGYDEMVNLVASKVIEISPFQAVDLGMGVGNIAELILCASADTYLTGIEQSEAMARFAQKKLEPFPNRSKIQIQNLQEGLNERKYSVAYSNLVLHNIDQNEKINLLTEIKRSLLPKGQFIWGDLVSFPFGMHNPIVAYRHLNAWIQGADAGFVKEDLYKELFEDSKLSVRETIKLCRTVGFKDPRVIWKNTAGTTAVFQMSV